MAESRRKIHPRIRLVTGGEKVLAGLGIEFDLESDCASFRLDWALLGLI